MSHSTVISININSAETTMTMFLGTRKVSERFNVPVGKSKSWTNAEAVEVLDIIRENDYGIGDHYEKLINLAIEMINYQQDMEMQYREPNDTSPMPTYVVVEISHFD